MPWNCHTEGTIRHVWPTDEVHDTEGLDCHCNPTSKCGEGGIIVVTHKSSDGREYIEQLVDDKSISLN